MEVNGEEFFTPVFVFFFLLVTFFVFFVDCYFFFFLLKYVSVNAAQYIKVCIPEWKEGVHRVECTGCSALLLSPDLD